jgi:CubicO group peptidase (beta-lactamase class C family)
MCVRAWCVLVSVSYFFSAPSLIAQESRTEIAGSWDSERGFVFIQTEPIAGKKQLSVKGTYFPGPDQKGIITSGTYDPANGVLEYSFEELWRKPSKGSAQITIGPKGLHGKGTYQIGDEKGDLTFTRVHGDNFVSRVDSIVANMGIGAETPGAAVMIVEGGRVVFEKGYGVAHFKDNRHISPHTTFELASCSKAFTGAAILRLYEQGKLKLEDDVREFIPELPVYDPKHPIHILELSRHTSGLPEYMDFPDVKGKNPKFVTNSDYADVFARDRKKFPLYFPPGEKGRYTNTNYMLLALIVERVSKKSYAQFLKSEIFDPLGMKTAAVYENPKAEIKDPALGYAKDKQKGMFQDIWGPPPFRHESNLVVGDGSVWVSLQDMAAWDEGWRHRKVLKEETMKHALVPSKTRDGKDNGYAFGWILDYDNDKLNGMSHAGAWGGFHTVVDRNISANRTIVILSNWDLIDPGKISGPVEHLCWTIPHKGK